MDQDFHYYGTYYAARQGTFSKEDATLIAKSANFIDFFNETTYAAYWKLVNNTSKTESYNIIASVDCPRYTFQESNLSKFASPEDGLWCSYHFTPGNYNDPPNTPTRESIHGQEIVHLMPPFQVRDTNGGRDILSGKWYTPDQNRQYKNDLRYGFMLNRPQSALSREIIRDAILCARDDTRLDAILRYAAGGEHILGTNRADNLRRFRLILLGVRAHVIADTWAHQDFSGLHNVLNTYWDVNYDPNSWDPSKWGIGRQSIDYDDGTTSGWKNIVLSATSNSNLMAAPNNTSYLGHGWMGHLPDFSFTKYRYKPCWSNPANGAIERDNPSQYKYAWIELLSLFNQAAGAGQLHLTPQFQSAVDKAERAIRSPCTLTSSTNGRASSATAWQAQFSDPPSTLINVNNEPDETAVLSGMIEATRRADRYGTDYVNINSDLYLFQIAADYHFHFVRSFLRTHSLYEYTGSWSQQTSALSNDVDNLFNAFVPNSNNQLRYGVRYRIKSVGHGTVLDDWAGKVGENSAALQPDDAPNSPNRQWILVPNAQGFRIKSATHGTVLDDWAGKTGKLSAALQPDDTPNSLNRTWCLAPNAQGFRIKSVGHGTVLDDWAGQVGENSAALQPDDVPDSLNRTWSFVAV